MVDPTYFDSGWILSDRMCKIPMSLLTSIANVLHNKNRIVTVNQFPVVTMCYDSYVHSVIKVVFIFFILFPTTPCRHGVALCTASGEVRISLTSAAGLSIFFCFSNDAAMHACRRQTRGSRRVVGWRPSRVHHVTSAAQRDGKSEPAPGA
jgi:hypothetical protein